MFISVPYGAAPKVGYGGKHKHFINISVKKIFIHMRTVNILAFNEHYDMNEKIL